MSSDYYILEYIPQRFNTTEEEEKYRIIIYNFKDGIMTKTLKKLFCKKVRRIIYNHSSFETLKTINEKWIICFIPASTQSKTIKRFKKLGEYIQEKTDFPVAWDTIYLKKDKEAGHISGKNENPTENFNYKTDCFQNKHILLIDDITTRGITFEQTRNALLQQGAKEVIGLFLAKTIHKE